MVNLMLAAHVAQTVAACLLLLQLLPAHKAGRRGRKAAEQLKSEGEGIAIGSASNIIRPAARGIRTCDVC